MSPSFAPSSARWSSASASRLALLCRAPGLLWGCVPELHSPDGDTGGTWVAPKNTWPVSAPPDDLVGEGYSEGQVFPEFRLMDQHGDELSLWQFYGSVIVVDVSTMWCGPCAALADYVDETAAAYAAQGFVYITVLPEDNVGSVPDQEDLQRWASDHDISQPIVSDDLGISYTMVPDSTWPRIMVVDRQMRIVVDRVNPVEDAAVRAAIEANL